MTTEPTPIEIAETAAEPPAPKALKDYKAAEDIDSWCIKCLEMTRHVIIAIVDEKPKKVQCHACKHKHVYRSAKPGTKKRSSSRSAAARAGLKASDYGKYMEGRSASDALRYTMKGDFSPGVVINHTKFGTGVVVQLKDSTKIEVIFPEGPKVLVHRRPA